MTDSFYAEALKTSKRDSRYVGRLSQGGASAELRVATGASVNLKSGWPGIDIKLGGSFHGIPIPISINFHTGRRVGRRTLKAR